VSSLARRALARAQHRQAARAHVRSAAGGRARRSFAQAGQRHPGRVRTHGARARHDHRHAGVGAGTDAQADRGLQGGAALRAHGRGDLPRRVRRARSRYQRHARRHRAAGARERAGPVALGGRRSQRTHRLDLPRRVPDHRRLGQPHGLGAERVRRRDTASDPGLARRAALGARRRAALPRRVPRAVPRRQRDARPDRAPVARVLGGLGARLARRPVARFRRRVPGRVPLDAATLEHNGRDAAAAAARNEHADRLGQGRSPVGTHRRGRAWTAPMHSSRAA